MSKNPFKVIRPQDPIAKKAREWGKMKFNPVRMHEESLEAATPWSKFKDDLNQAKYEENQAKKWNTDSKTAKEIHKQRQQNYKKMLITEKAKSSKPTKWEKFSDDEKNCDKKSKTSVTKKPLKAKHKQTNNDKFNKPFKAKDEISKQPNTKPNFKLFEPGELKNFDSLKVSAEQNRNMVRLLTKGTTRLFPSFRESVNDMKRNGVRPPNKKRS